MTGPIHAISWLKADPQNASGAHFALNRSMLAACYGPFNVRNEVRALHQSGMDANAHQHTHARALTPTHPQTRTHTHTHAHTHAHITHSHTHALVQVDKHNLTVGGHFDNTHFLTGDGGFVQVLVNGYAGFMLANQGWLGPPAVYSTMSLHLGC
jgi:hypothetical protein